MSEPNGDWRLVLQATIEAALLQIRSAKEECISTVQSAYEELERIVQERQLKIAAEIEALEKSCGYITDLCTAAGALSSFSVRLSRPWSAISHSILQSIVLVPAGAVDSAVAVPVGSSDSVLTVARELVSAGRRLMHMEEFQQAKAVSKKAVGLVKERFPLHEVTAQALTLLGRIRDVGWKDIAKAESLYLSAIAICKPHYPKSDTLIQALAALGCLYADKGEGTKGKELLISALRTSSSGSESRVYVYNALAYVHTALGRWSKALALYSKSLQSSSIQCPWLRSLMSYNVATCYDNLSNPIAALEGYQQTLSLRPLYPIHLRCYINIGLLNYRLNNVQQTKAAFDAGVELGRREMSASRSLAELIEKQSMLLLHFQRAERVQLLEAAAHILATAHWNSRERVENAILLGAAYIDWAANGRCDLQRATQALTAAIKVAGKRYPSLLSECYARLAFCKVLESCFVPADYVLAAAMRRQVNSAPEENDWRLEKLRFLYSTN